MLLQSRAPKHMWDDCLELEAYVRSNIAHDIYKLDGEIPKTVMLGDTSAIIQCCKLQWFKWIMFQDETASFLKDALK